MIHCLGSKVGQSVAEATASNAEMQSFYGFFNSKQVMPEYMVLSELDRLRAFLEKAPPMTILGPQDTTDIDLTGKVASAGLGSLNYERRKGFYAHTLMLTDAEGVSLGIFDQYLWSRDASAFGKKKALAPIEKKETYRWVQSFERFERFFAGFPRHRAISICDREGDFFELFAVPRAENVHLLVRADKNRSGIGQKGEKEKLWEKLGSAPPVFAYKTKVFNPKGKKEEVILEVKHAPILIGANYRFRRDQKTDKEVQLWAVQTKQVSPMLAWQKHPICWRLLTTMAVESVEQAIEVIDFYILRWRIEEFHYVLKQGCKVEDLQFKEPHALRNAIAFFSLIACKVLNIRYAIHAKSSQPVEAFGFTQMQFLIICSFLLQKGTIKSMPQQPCADMGEFIRLLALLHSVANPKRPPGVKAIWMALRKLEEITSAFSAFQNVNEHIRFFYADLE
jgi:hypothetical protein